ncbi:MAG: IreB family regulatory phosphoprotein [Bacilli bacterium]|nr:IreB family regulatory phosphoprotein [Bacilli bacterium]
MNDTTHLYSIEEFEEKLVSETVKEVYHALEERGYNPVNQLVGYLMSGDPGYISSHKESRNKITKIDRSKILEVLLKDYIKNI